MEKTIYEFLPDEEMNEVWGNANFGMPRRDVIKYALLKYASGYSTGHTAKTILSELGLLNQNLTLSKKGKQYLFLAFYDGNSL